MDKLNLINDQFLVYGVSNISESLAKGTLHGRLYGGEAIMWRKSLSTPIKLLDLTLKIAVLRFSYRCRVLANVYFPCYSNSIQNKAQLSQWFGFIEHAQSSNVHTD